MFLQRLFLMASALFFVQNAYAQFVENFNDGDLSGFPAWAGDTASFVINGDLELQLNEIARSDEKYVFTTSHAIEDAVWIFDVSMEFNPSSANLTEIHIISDNPDYTLSNGYFVRIGYTSDEISLYRKDGAGETKIIDGADDRVNLSNVKARIKATRDPSGNWELFSDVGITGNFISEGKVFDNTYLSSEYFGIFCHYTSTRSDKFFFDNISVSGQSKSDTIPPAITEVHVLDEKNLTVLFSEKTTFSGENISSHFLENCHFSQPEQTEFLNDSTIQLTFAESFPENMICSLIITDISDRANNILENSSVDFIYVPPQQPDLNELLITEIMADPTPNRELPEYEYLEIFNPTDDEFNVRDLELRLRDEIKTLPDFVIKSGEFIIICPNLAKDDFSEYGKTIGVSNWKSLLNGGDTLDLYNRYGQLVFNFIYSDEWYHDVERSEGGYSLEMVDTQNPCGESNNWRVTQDEKGGTPGQINSIRQENPDLTPPIIESVYPVSKNNVEINFNERVVTNSLIMSDFSITPEIPIGKVLSTKAVSHSLDLLLSNSLQARKSYTLTLTTFEDCANNVAKNEKTDFVLPEQADSLDIVFNEIMFNPVPGGVDFIELINISDKYIDLQDWKFIREVDGELKETSILSLSHLIFRPGEIMVFTENKDVLLGQFPFAPASQIHETELIPLNDDAGTVLLVNPQENTIDKLHYSEGKHHVLIKNKEGVSLERISYGGGSTQSEIWQSAASATNSATPGLKNSHFIDLGISSSFYIEPKTFEPNNDGYRDFVRIHFAFENTSLLASLYVFDLSGRIVKTLLNHETIPTEHFVVWYGENEHGQKVPVGNYIVLMELFDPNGEKSVMKETVAVAKRF